MFALRWFRSQDTPHLFKSWNTKVLLKLKWHCAWNPRFDNICHKKTWMDTKSSHTVVKVSQNVPSGEGIMVFKSQMTIQRWILLVTQHCLCKNWQPGSNTKYLLEKTGLAAKIPIVFSTKGRGCLSRWEVHLSRWRVGRLLRWGEGRLTTYVL